MRLSVYLIAAIASTIYGQTFNFSDPKVGATLENFVVVTDDSAVTTFGCNDSGARCVFRRSSYKSFDFGTGQETEDVQGAVWAAVVEGAVLTLGPCMNNGNCIVTCNANCTCAYVTDDSGGPQICTQVTSRAPTPAPKTEAPVFSECPERQFTEFCPELMATALPEGVENNYDCYNFCGGIWVSTCDYSGNCGTLNCENKTSAGTLAGQVFGCVVSDKKLYTGSINAEDNSSGAVSIISFWNAPLMMAMGIASAVLLC
jgi:hypothetical protein